ncbi:MAG: tetratricopeptide repeat protein [Thermomicrobiales bacterium]|nr:tetratricopeptide repeat protein [Thermomicrobiales bacterium]
MPGFPAGTVTFLFTDIEQSAALWERTPASARVVVERQFALVRQGIAANGGVLYKLIGDATQSAFATAAQGIAAALDAQRTLAGEPWPSADERPRVRMALHAGAAEPRDGDYLAPCLNRLSRLLDAAHGEQILVSEIVADLASGLLPPDASLRRLGEFRLRDLLQPEEVFQLCHPALRADFPPLDTAGRLSHNLPAQPTPFLGREREVEEVVALLLQPDVRLVTLTGAGGVGKTRLGLRVAAEALESFPDGAFLIDLARQTDPDAVPTATAAALGLREQPGQGLAETVAAYLRERRMLLLFDNFEHVLPAVTFVAGLLAAAPGISILATSRARLGLQAEHEYRVETLPLPDLAALPPLEDLARYDAIALFVARARALRPEFALTPQNAAAVAAICARVDGLPLAIELAAARVKLLTPDALLARLDRRLSTLVGGARDLPQRQRTLRDTIAWSHDLLAPDEAALFRRLSVFVGGWTLEGADAVSVVDDGGDDALAGVAALVDQSLVDQWPGDDEPRYGMLESIREFASDQLAGSGEAEAVQHAFEAFLIARAGQAEAGLLGPEQPRWLERLAAEHDNLRAALASIVGRGDGAAAMRLAPRLWRFWKLRGFPSEGRTWLERALALADRDDAAGRATAELGLGELAMETPDLAAAEAHYRASLALCEQQGDRRGIAFALSGLLIVAVNRYAYGEAKAFGERALRLRRELGDERGVAISLSNLAMVAREQGDLERAAAMYEEALALWRKRKEPSWLADTVQALGITRRMTGDQAAARALLTESQELQRQLGYDFGLAVSAIELGHLARAEGDLAAALASYVSALRQFTALGASLGAVEALEWLAATAVDQQAPERALRLFAAASAARQALTLPPPAPSDAAVLERQRQRAVEVAGTAAAHAASEGHRLTLGEITEEALRSEAGQTLGQVRERA